jgi:hypothetical protein
MPQNEERDPRRSDEEYDRVNRLDEVRRSEELDEAKTNLKAFMQERAGSEQQPQSSGRLGPDAEFCFLSSQAYAIEYPGRV